MKNVHTIVAAAVLLVAAGWQVQGGDGEGEIRRGEYLALHVAQCVQCHTPRNEAGELERARLFHGSVIPVEGPAFVEEEEWAERAPAIAGLAGYRVEIAFSILTKGVRPDGEPPRNPMPPFRMQPDDAKAIIAYLHSLE